MESTRRTFLTTSLAATAALAASARAASTAPAPGKAAAPSREFYELRCYRLKAETRLKANADRGPLDAYLEQALLPALAGRGIKNVGVFTEITVDKPKATSTPVPDSPVWVLIPHANLGSFVSVSGDINNNATVQKAGASYLKVEKAAPAFERIDSWLLRAFAGMPQMGVPEHSQKKTPTRVFEMRDYESHSELKALNKMKMFNAGEIQVMKELGMSPVFFGQALAGPNLPHLRYITSGPDLATHLGNWKKFGGHPLWAKLKSDPQYANNTSKNTARFVVPTAYSEL